MKVYSPNAALNATKAGVTFTDGVAEVDEENSSALAYFRRHGYGVGSKPASPEPVEPEVDARDVTAPESIGTRLRDAAVDPQPEDFLPPVNAGEADPHGPHVVAPEIHASGPAGIHPGIVGVGEPERQNAQERALAKARLIEREPASTFAADEDADRGPLDMSDPGSVEESSDDGIADGPDLPTKSAAKGDWVAYAVAQGLSADEADALTKTELVDRFGG